MSAGLSLWLTSGRTLNIAHRGASGVAPANTIAAFEKAAELGADGVELDAHLCADGVPVVIHDFFLQSTTNGTGPVAAQPLAALAELDAGSWFDPSFAGERIPTLAQVFESVGQRLLINVELKSQSREDRGLERAVIDLVERYKMSDRVLISSFDPYALRRVRSLAPHLPLGLLYSPLPSSWLGRVRAWRMRTLHPDTINPHWALLRPATIRRAHARGRRVVTWTVDQVEVMRRLCLWKVDGIITNHPDRLRAVLEAG